MFYGCFRIGDVSIEMITKEQTVSFMKKNASRGFFDGTHRTQGYFNICRYYHCPSKTNIIFTKDVGYYSSGWFKNPDYERCYHLSLSFKVVESGQIYNLPKNEKLTDEWIELFFGDNKKWIWTEPPFSEEGKKEDVWHYRLFCDKMWQPIKPRKEVYTREFTEKGWKSFSELKGEQK